MKKITKSVPLYESQIDAIQLMADDMCEGDFGRAMRSIVDLWIADNVVKTTTDSECPRGNS